MVTVVETKEYQNKSGKLVADKDERSAIINYLSEHPNLVTFNKEQEAFVSYDGLFQEKEKVAVFE